MADLIDVKEALSLLGCDEKTLTGYITSGSIRAQKVGGKLMVDQGDVEKVAGGGADDDVSIVLTGDSENLSIDLGKVEDAAATVTEKPAKGTTDSITFADEMEVVNIEQDQTSAQPKAGMDLGFTEQHTAVLETVTDNTTGAQTVVGTTTEDVDAALDSADMSGSVDEDRPRGRGREYAETPIPGWIGLTLAASLAMLALGVLPYVFLTSWPHENQIDYAGNVKRGAIDGIWSSVAAMAPFSVSPELKDNIRDSDPQAKLRAQEYRTAYRSDNGDTSSSFLIEKVSEDGRTATSKGGKTFPIVQKKSTIANQEVTEDVVDIGLAQ